MISSSYTKPLPPIDEASKPFWDAARQRKFVLWHCRSCDAYYFPMTYCHCSIEPDMGWDLATGKGSLFTWTIFHTAYHPSFRDDVPYNVGVVKLQEGPFFITNIVECSNDELAVGLPVEVTFDEVTDNVTLVKFRPSR